MTRWINRTIFILLLHLLLVAPSYASSPTYPMSKQFNQPRYNITTNHRSNFVYFRVAKTGTRSILSMLKQYFPLTINERSGQPYNSYQYGNYFKFTIVRNPWDRLVSCYFNKVYHRRYPAFEECREMSFEEFVEWLATKDLKRIDVHARLQSSLFPIHEMDYIGRFERLDEEIREIASRLGIKKIRVPHNNSSDHKHYSYYYNDRTRELVRELYKEDIENFGYTFNEPDVSPTDEGN